MKHECQRCDWERQRGIGVSRNVVFCPRMAADGLMAINLGHCRRVRNMPPLKAKNHILQRKYATRYQWYQERCGYDENGRKNGRASARSAPATRHGGQSKAGGQPVSGRNAKGLRVAHTPNGHAPMGHDRKMGRQDTARQSRASDGLRA